MTKLYILLAIPLGALVGGFFCAAILLYLVWMIAKEAWKQIAGYWKVTRKAIDRSEVKGMEREGNLYIVRKAGQTTIEESEYLF